MKSEVGNELKTKRINYLNLTLGIVYTYSVCFENARIENMSDIICYCTSVRNQNTAEGC